MSSKSLKYLRREGGASSRYCCVPFCKMSSRFNSVISFHSFPLDDEIRKKWLLNVGRTDLHVSPNTRVCSRHFKSDDLIEPSTPTARRLLKKGAVPTVFPRNESTPELRKKRKVFIHFEEDRVPADLPYQDHDYCSSPVQVNLAVETEALRKQLESLRRQVEEMTVLQRFCLGRFAASDDDISFYTRFATYNHLMAFWRLIEPASHNMLRLTRATTTSEDGASDSASYQSLQPIDEFFLFMVHLSIGLTKRDLGHRFNIHRSTASQIITKWTNFLYTILRSVHIWMSEEVVKAQMPKEFKDFPDTQVVIDCAELRCRTPYSLRLLGEEPQCSFKGLIGVAPHGGVTFVSSLYAGTVSDDEILKQSGIASLLEPGMAIMVDKGFFVDECGPCKVYRPAYLFKQEEFRASEVKETQSIARLRVYVELLICRVRQHQLFDTVIRLSNIRTINQLYTVACHLTNYQNGPLIQAWAKD